MLGWFFYFCNWHYKWITWLTAVCIKFEGNQTEKTQLSPTVDKAAPAAGAEDVSQVPASMSQVPTSSSTEEKKPPTPEADHSPVKPQQGAKEGGVEHPAEGKEEEEEKVADDPPLDLLADESQNDLDDDIVCVSMTPGKGFRVNEGSGQKQVQKDSPQKTTTPSKDSK